MDKDLGGTLVVGVLVAVESQNLFNADDTDRTDY